MGEPKLVIAYKAKYNPSCDGLGPDIVVGIYLEESTAKARVMGKAPHGGNGSVEEVLVADIGDGHCVEIASVLWGTHSLVR